MPDPLDHPLTGANRPRPLGSSALAAVIAVNRVGCRATRASSRGLPTPSMGSGGSAPPESLS